MTTQVASPVSAHGPFRKPLQVAVLGAVAALAFTGGMLVRQTREESATTSPVAVQQHSTGGESPRATATAKPLTLYLVGSDEDAGRMRSALEVMTDTDGQPAATNAQLFAVGTAGSATLNDARLQVVDLRSAGTAQHATVAVPPPAAGALDQPHFMP